MLAFSMSFCGNQMSVLEILFLIAGIKYALIIGNTTALKDGLGAKLYDKVRENNYNILIENFSWM
jgi:hypothetical protein